jgi:citrate lyase beta subunit
MLAKAAALAPDEAILDLEDAVAPAEKAAARDRVAEALAQRWTAATVAVRVNAIGTRWWRDDLAVAARAAVVVVPKVESAEQLEAIAALLPAATALEAQIETARGLVEVERIAAARVPLEALVFGPGDLAASLGMPQLAIGAPGEQWHYAMARIVTAARAFRLQAVDGPFGRLDDAEGLRESARTAWLLGYDGKWAIHPDQVALCNEVFTPAPEDIERAERLLGIAGAARVDGELVDEATRRMAESILRRAGRRLG